MSVRNAEFHSAPTLFSIVREIYCEIIGTGERLSLPRVRLSRLQVIMELEVRVEGPRPAVGVSLKGLSRSDLLPPEANLRLARARPRVDIPFLLPASYPPVDGGDAGPCLLGDVPRRLASHPHPDHPSPLRRVGGLVGLTSLHGLAGGDRVPSSASLVLVGYTRRILYCRLSKAFLSSELGNE